MDINIPDQYKLFEREYKVSPVEFYRIQLSFICPDVNNTKLTIMAYLYHFGYEEGTKRLLEDKIVISQSSLYNFISSLRKEGLIIGFTTEIELVPEITLCDSDHITLLKLSKDETKNEVGHKYFRT